MTKIYSGFFLEDGTHCTWEFNPGKCELPQGISEGDEVTLLRVGKYSDEDVECLIVRLVLPGSVNGKIQKQPSGTLLHITTRCENGVKPVESGLRATEKGYDYDWLVNGEVLKATAGYFYA